MELFLYAPDLPQLTLAGSVTIPAPNCHFERRPTDFILYFLTDGAMSIYEDDRRYDLQKGDFMLLDPSHVHKGIPTNSDVSYYYLHFNAQNMRLVEDAMIDLQQILLDNKLETAKQDILILPKYLSVSNYGLMKSQFQFLCTTFAKKGDCYRTTLSIHLLELLTECSLRFQSQQTLTRNSDLILSLIQYLQSCTTLTVTSKMIEEQFHMNFDYLNRLFKASTHTTIVDYANHYRIAESKKLLESGMYNVRQTAALMGFSNEFYFSKVYKKYEGVAPSYVKNK